MTDEAMMQDLMGYARNKMDQLNTLPFCAYVAKDGVVIAKGCYDGYDYGAPTQHGEMIAIRKACQSLRSYENLAGCVLFTTCEPCLACFETALLTGIKRIVYAATHEDSAVKIFFNKHNYYLQDYVRQHPGEISLQVSKQREAAIKLFAEARERHGL